MSSKMVYVCSCGTTWDTNSWGSVETHLNANNTHVITEGYAHTSMTGVPDKIPMRATDGTVYRVEPNTFGGLISESNSVSATKVPKATMDATTDPSMSQDITQGYEIGSRWFNNVTSTQFFCVNSTAGVAIWVVGGDLIRTLSPVIRDTNPGVTQAELDAGFFDGIYTSTSDLPNPPSTIPGFAWINNGTRYPDLAWWQNGSSSWDVVSYPYPKPIDPLGENLISPSVSGLNNYNWSTYAMGTVFRINPVGNGRTINRVSFFQGPGGVGNHQWALIRSTLVQTTTPPINTFTNTVLSGVFTVGAPSAWTHVNVNWNVLQGEHYWIAKWTGPGGTTQSVAPLRSSGLLNETYATLEGGAYASGAVSTPPGSVPNPSAGPNAGSLWGISSVRII